MYSVIKLQLMLLVHSLIFDIDVCRAIMME